MLQLQSYNPAAVLGYNPSRLHVNARQSTDTLAAYRKGVRQSKYDGFVAVADLNLQSVILALPMFAVNSKGCTGQPNARLYFDGVQPDEIMEIVALMHQTGIPVDDPLLARQAAAIANGGASLAEQAAYDRFIATADVFLTRVRALNLPCLSKTKGIRDAVTPCKARALTAGSAGFHVMPDPYDERYVQLVGFSVTTVEHMAVRDLAFDCFESFGLRVEIRYP